MGKDLLKYIPKEYKNQVESIERGKKVWNEYTRKWNIIVNVTWKDGEVSNYQNASYMYSMLKEFGRN